MSISIPRARGVASAVLLATACATCLGALATEPAGAAQPPVGLGTAGSFAVLAGSAVTNTGPSVVNGDLGIAPGTAITGFPPGLVNGAMHPTDAVAGQAQSDLTAAYVDAAGRTPAAAIAGDIGGLTLTPGVFKSTSSVLLTGDVTLDAQGDPNAVFLFQIGSTLTTASASRVVLVNGASPCNVFWQVGSSATFGTATTFAGSVLALTSIGATTAATFDGQLLARNGAVTLDTNTVSRGTCAALPVTPIPPPAGPGPTAGTPGTPAPPGTAGTPTTTAGPGAPPPTGASATNGTAILATTPRTVARRIARFGTRRCVGGRFRAVVTGTRIRRVVFTVGGRTVATRTRAPFQAWVVTRGGVHTARALVTFADATRPVRLRLVFRTCAEPRAAVVGPVRRTPHFTG
jgi:hypothetical protein